ncbi:hypothetical protein [Chryseobacterium sp. R2A-55]|uniref:hypothetical protein n=1 Tax=Chryseobacterium sp. R2A-55 TaxID=2744445 RepID=UPI001F3B4A6F|nr:hypothetical protein [Chryseobacterium sp. R2A-55]
MKNTIIELEDNGQDFLEIVCDENGEIIETKPFQSSIWKGGFIPIKSPDMLLPGLPCPIHKPPHINYGFLKHRIKNVTTKEN